MESIFVNNLQLISVNIPKNKKQKKKKKGYAKMRGV